MGAFRVVRGEGCFWCVFFNVCGVICRGYAAGWSVLTYSFVQLNNQRMNVFGNIEFFGFVVWFID